MITKINETIGKILERTHVLAGEALDLRGTEGESLGHARLSRISNLGRLALDLEGDVHELREYIRSARKTVKRSIRKDGDKLTKSEDLDPEKVAAEGTSAIISGVKKSEPEVDEYLEKLGRGSGVLETDIVLIDARGVPIYLRNSRTFMAIGSRGIPFVLLDLKKILSTAGVNHSSGSADASDNYVSLGRLTIQGEAVSDNLSGRVGYLVSLAAARKIAKLQQDLAIQHRLDVEAGRKRAGGEWKPEVAIVTIERIASENPPGDPEKKTADVSK